jgi:hypothetical protein
MDGLKHLGWIKGNAGGMGGGELRANLPGSEHDAGTIFDEEQVSEATVDSCNTSTRAFKRPLVTPQIHADEETRVFRGMSRWPVFSVPSNSVRDTVDERG